MIDTKRADTKRAEKFIELTAEEQALTIIQCGRDLAATIIGHAVKGQPPGRLTVNVGVLRVMAMTVLATEVFNTVRRFGKDPSEVLDEIKCGISHEYEDLRTTPEDQLEREQVGVPRT